MISWSTIRERLRVEELLAEKNAGSRDDREPAPGTTIRRVVFDSRDVRPGDCFVAIRGELSDGHLFIDKAVFNGAHTIVCEAASANSREGFPDVAIVHVTDSRKALLAISSVMNDDPGEKMTLIGTTGTNGKTTVATLVRFVLQSQGTECGLVGTTGYGYRDIHYEARTTTPSPTRLYALLSEMNAVGVKACSMEVSSHALVQSRVRIRDFNVAIFTNLTRDHLDYHRTNEAYFEAKKKLFDGLDSTATAVVNADDESGRSVCRDTNAHVITFGTGDDVDVKYKIVGGDPRALRMQIDGAESSFRLAGRFNAENLAAAYSAGVSLGISGSSVLYSLSAAPPVRGRFQVLAATCSRSVIIDYAHTPDALENVLREARKHTPEGSKLWCIFGCGGDRDAGKRPIMGAIAEKHADHVVLTDDNPRRENSSTIMSDIRSGMLNPDAATCIADRRKAIHYSADQTFDGDVIVVAGKGHETVQIIGAERLAFDDSEVAGAAFDVKVPSESWKRTQEL